MEAFHSFWSRPSRVIHWDEVRFADFELLTMMLSALEWRARNGPIRMITDSAGAAWFDHAGLTGLWDSVTTGLDRVPEDIDPYLFWAGGKLYALASMPCPCVMLDTDLIVWRGLEVPPGLDVVAAHGEPLYPDVYPDPRTFTLKEGYRLPGEWDFSLNAANTAFLYLRHEDFRDYYTASAAAFMRGVEGKGLDPTSAMCTAEQRLLPMCAKAKGQNLAYLLDLDRADDQDFVTHVWGYKRAMKEIEPRRYAFCVKCARRILRSHPQAAGLLAQNKDLSQYLDAAADSLYGTQSGAETEGRLP